METEPAPCVACSPNVAEELRDALPAPPAASGAARCLRGLEQRSAGASRGAAACSGLCIGSAACGEPRPGTNPLHRGTAAHRGWLCCRNHGNERVFHGNGRDFRGNGWVFLHPGRPHRSRVTDLGQASPVPAQLAVLQDGLPLSLPRRRKCNGRAGPGARPPPGWPALMPRCFSKGIWTEALQTHFLPRRHPLMGTGLAPSHPARLPNVRGSTPPGCSRGPCCPPCSRPACPFLMPSRTGTDPSPFPSPGSSTSGAFIRSGSS